MNPTAEREKEPENISAGETLSICILDDEPTMVATLGKTVERFGYSSWGTSDPYAALDLIRKQRCRVALCDVKMPGMTGIAFLEKKIDPGMYVILMSGFYSMDAAMDAIRRGAYDYLPKPVESER